MFAIPNTTISSAVYTAAQSWEYDAENTSGYLFCSAEPVYVRLTTGLDLPRVLQEFFMAPGAQTILVQDEGEPVTKVEVRLAKAGGSPAQFWGVLATSKDPLRTFVPTNLSANSGGGFNPPIVQTPLIFQHNTVQQSVEGTADFEDSNSLQWTVTDDAANSRAKIKGDTNLELDLVNSAVPGTVTISATTLGTAQTIIQSDPITISNVLGSINMHIECYIPRVKNTTPGQSFDLVLVLTDTFDASAVQIGEIQLAADSHVPFHFRRWFVPAAGNHTWAIKGFVGANHADCQGIDTPMQLHIGQFT